MKRNQTVLAVLITALFVFAIGATWAVAESDGVIYACVNPAGAVSIVEDSVSCNPRETLLEWNIHGEKGDKGDQGDVGPQGPPGVPVFYMGHENVRVDSLETTVGVAHCDSGDVAVGGGYRLGGFVAGSGILEVVENGPSFDQTSWIFQGKILDGDGTKAYSLNLRVVCADLTP